MILKILPRKQAKALYFKNRCLITRMQAMPGTVPAVKIPIAILIQQACDLQILCEKDKEKLTAAGLTQHAYEKLIRDTRICMDLETQWQVARHDLKGDSQQLRDLAGESRRVRAKLREQLNLYCESKDIPRRVAGVSCKRSRADVAQDLLELALMFENVLKESPQTRFDTQLPAEARRLSDALLGSVAGHAGDHIQSKTLRAQRDAAVGALFQHIIAIRTIGKFAFCDDPLRRKAYTSNYPAR
jgi:hypothetical protein